MLPIYSFGVLLEENREADRERRLIILNLNRERRLMRSESDPFGYSDNHFRSLYRLTKEMVHYLIQQLTPHIMQDAHYNAVDTNLKIFAALFFYANGSYQRVVGHSHTLWMGQTTINKYITQITNLIVDHMSDNWIIFPTTPEEKLRIKTQFMEKSQFPGVVGVIDCTHIAMIAPNVEEHNYINRKGYHSKNVQLICDSDLKILNVNAQYAGAAHDSFIWRNSAIKDEMQNAYQNGDTNSWLLGLMTPVLNAVDGTAEDRYNIRHRSTRNCIERCNGVLKNRFRCLLGERTLRYNPEKVGNLVVACCVLHNICTEGRLAEPAVEEEIQDIVDGVHIQNDPVQGRNARAMLIQRYFEN